MFEIITSILFPNNVPGTMPSLLLFSYLDSTHFSGFFGYITHGGRLFMT